MRMRRLSRSTSRPPATCMPPSSGICVPGPGRRSATSTLRIRVGAGTPSRRSTIRRRPDRLGMRIAPRTLLCATAYRIRSGRVGTDFSELKELCASAGDERSLAIGLAGVALATQLEVGPRQASALATELVRLLESIGDPELTVTLSMAPLTNNLQGGKISAALQWADRVKDWPTVTKWCGARHGCQTPPGVA